MIADLHKLLTDAGLPIAGIYESDNQIGTRDFLTPEQQTQFDAIVADYQANAPKTEAIHALWVHVNQLYIDERVSKGWDENASGAVTLWAALGEITPARAARLADVRAWGDTAWMLYYQVKSLIEAGQPYELPALPAPCPWHFAQVLFADQETP